MIRTVLLACVFLLVPAAAVPGEATPRAALERYFAEVETVEGRFTQVVRDEDGQVLEESRGTLAIQRPDRFDWFYREPFEQRIVADGEYLWIHDPGLQQVTVQPLEETLGTGAALLLSGRLDTLEEQFRMDTDGDWLVLTPRDEGWNLTEARLRMGDGLPEEIVVRDGLGQETRLTLRDLRTGVEFAADRFRFEPDADTDVIEQNGADLDR
ncbi:outer membrane lipoprotein chaperone LolA [Aquisalimonas lutea]|uniref:outer membrane lipoprotein chaperone LolA n=1 Tax=Aquisalimonas lutea TaxID=1327750 RepID=UPI0025B3BFFD|nr:outer membrane lipoprotein chaperone LolA [Aquisalimonas lutea]MDN3518596.1 outer membrane lipoprotein chaperone LolA [Aquisalimonas lutea]